MDRIDLKILQALQEDARMTNQALSERVGLSPSPCLQRVKRLERQGLLRAYRAEIELEKVCRSVTVIATVTLRAHEEVDFKDFEAAIRDMPEVVECVKVSGAFDYLLRFVCPDIGRYHSLSEELLKSSNGIAQLSSHVVLDQTKAFEGFPLESLV